MDSELLCEIIERIECVAGIETLLIFTVAALNFSVVPWGVGANQFVPDAQLGSSRFK